MPANGAASVILLLTLTVFYQGTAVTSSSITENILSSAGDPLLNQVSVDPLADKDSFEILTKKEQETLWTFAAERTIQDRLKEVQEPFEYVVPIDVKLVGFDTDGNLDVNFKESQLLSYLEASPSEFFATLIKAQHGESNTLPIRHKFTFNVAKANKKLNLGIQEAVQNAMMKGRAVPYTVVDAHIEKDFKDNPLPVYTFYILNPKTPVQPGAGFALNYWYMHAEPGMRATADKPSETCGGSVYVSKTERYLWIDLTAGPVSYGPHTSGEGIVWPLSLPRPGRYISESGYMSQIDVFLSDLSALVLKACLYVFNPSMHSDAVEFHKAIIVRLTVIHDHSEWRNRTGLPPTEEKFVNKFQWDAIKRELDQLPLVGQRIIYTKTETDFADCEKCAAAMTQALKSHTSTVLSGGLRSHVHQYIDSVELHHWLQKLDPSLRNPYDSGYYRRNYYDDDIYDDDMYYDRFYYGEWEDDFAWPYWEDPESHDEERRIIRVYLFDLRRTDLLLLDRFHQAVSFPDMVIGVQTRAGQSSLDYECSEQRLSMDPNDASRPVLAALLQTGWSIAATHERWSDLRNESVVDWMFSTAITPFGYLSPYMGLTFSQRDSAARSILYNELLRTLFAVEHLLGHFAKYNKELDEVVAVETYSQFVRRWNMVRHKLNRAATFLSLHNYNTSLYYLRATRHDTKTMHSILKEASTKLHPYVACYQQAGPGVMQTVVMSLSILSVVLGVSFYIARTMGHMHSSKRLHS